MRDTTLLFLGCPERELSKSLADLLRLCTGEHTVNEIRRIAPEFSSAPIFETLQQLGYIILSQEPPRRRDTSPASKTLIVSPHMDDAFLSLGGTILCQRNDCEIHVVNVFGFDPWIKPLTRLRLTKQQQNSLRRREETFNAKLCGCEVKFWNYAAALNRGYSGWNDEINWKRNRRPFESIREDLLDLVKKQKYKEVIFPLGVGGHTDHRLITEVALSLISEINGERQVHFYEDLPYAAEPRNWRRWQRFSDLGERVEVERTYADIGSEIEYKMLLLQTYSSQLFFYEPYSIRLYHHREHMRTGIAGIDKEHKQRAADLQVYNERLWLIGPQQSQIGHCLRM